MKITSLAFYQLMNNSRALHTFSRRGTTAFITRHAKTLFRTIILRYRFNIKNRYFRITPTTRKRLNNIPIETVNGKDLAELGLSKLNETGVVYFDNGLHFIYAIGKSGVYIMASSTHGKRNIGTDNNYYHMETLMDGFIYVNFLSNKVEYIINSPIMCAAKDNDAFHFDEQVLKLAIKIIKDLEKQFPNSKENTSVLLEKADKKSLAGLHTVHFELLKNKVELCFRAFMFIHFAKIITSTVVSNKPSIKTLKMDRLLKRKTIYDDIIVVDTIYDETQQVINPFSVSGHFRNQPCGRNHNERKLIYIDTFMKTGYTRLATKIVENMDNNELEIDVPVTNEEW